MARLRVVHAFSAGGVVYRSISPSAATGSVLDPEYEVVLVGHPRDDIWVLPKGTPHAEETPEQTALREVQEETGIVPRIVGDLGSIQYWFTRKGVRYRKEVQHYLMVAIGGDVSQHDHEYDEARWFPLPEAIARLAHANEVDVVRRAEQMLAERSGRPGAS
jgi:8-oxo-dGTP pyrophosphatase MutT (NUDIX family)